MEKLSKSDLEWLQIKGIDRSILENQIQLFVQGFPFSLLSDAATRENGILSFSPQEQVYYEESYFSKVKNLKVLKFVPASGAATRMFKHLFEYKDELLAYNALYSEGSPNPLLFFLNDKKSYNIKNAMWSVPDPVPVPTGLVEVFFKKLSSFAFYPELKKIMEENEFDIEECLEFADYLPILFYLLEPKGLNYANLPKGLLTFHSYSFPEKNRTSIEEHLVEAATYAFTSSESKVYIHFTISPEHLPLFKKKLDEVLPYYQAKFKMTYDVSYSVQKSLTDTVAVDMTNHIFRSRDRKIVFRPAGHGALIENLNDLDADLIFIKNIDNVTVDSLRSDTTRFKKILGSVLLEYKTKIDEYLNILESLIGENSLDQSFGQASTMSSEKKSAIPSPTILSEIAQFVTQLLHIQLQDYDAQTLFHALNRPIRICGMVQNAGEPGGGPFWVLNQNGKVSLQIVESSQINLADSKQNAIFQAATHFNPVDIVCCTKNYQNKNFNLKQYVDPQTFFISEKSVNGKKIKALELPGLWNGAMANWITLFAEVPISVFTPVKTINDLLRQEH